MGRTRRTSPKATPHASNKGGTPPYHHLLSCEIGPPSCKAQPCKFHRTTQLSGCPSELPDSLPSRTTGAGLIDPPVVRLPVPARCPCGSSIFVILPPPG